MNTIVKPKFDDQNAHAEYLLGMAREYRRRFDLGEIPETEYQTVLSLLRTIKEIEELIDEL